MKYLKYLCLFYFLFCVSSIPCEAQSEMQEIFEQLTKINDEQEMIIQNLEKRNQELLLQSQNKQQILNEQEDLLKKQELLLKEGKKSSLTKAIISSTITGLLFFILGVLIL